MTIKQIVAIVLSLFCINVGVAQVVNPGGGVYAMSDVPGLTNALGDTLTNAYKGADTGTFTGAVSKVGRQVQVNFPTIPSVLNIATNFIHGTEYISTSGVTTINFLMSFPNVPFITLTPVGTNIAELLTPVVLSVTTNSATFSVLSSGAIVTNSAYRVDWQANDGSGLSWAGTSLAALGGVSNVYLNNGSNAMYKFYFPVGHGANKWLISDASGYGSWESKLIANLTDGADVFKKDGTVTATGDFAMGGKKIGDTTRIQVTDGAGAGKVLTSDASGWGTWQTLGLSSWSTFAAISTVNMNGNAISTVGALGVNGVATFNGTETHNGVGTYNNNTYFYKPITLSSALGYISADGGIHTRQTGGSYASPAFYTAGYNRFDDIIDARNGIIAYGNAGYSGVAFYTAAAGAHIGSQGDILAGSSAWITALLPTLGAPWGQIAAQYGLYSGGTLTVLGAKSFRMQHPVNTNMYLFHASVESPNPELIYRGKTTLVAGTAAVNLNTYYGLISNTLNSILTNVTVCVYNNASWTRVRCSAVSGVDFTILAETNTCTDEVEWMAIGRRCDPGVASYQIEVNK